MTVLHIFVPGPLVVVVVGLVVVVVVVVGLVVALGLVVAGLVFLVVALILAVSVAPTVIFTSTPTECHSFVIIVVVGIVGIGVAVNDHGSVGRFPPLNQSHSTLSFLLRILFGFPFPLLFLPFAIVLFCSRDDFDMTLSYPVLPVFSLCCRKQ